LREYRLRTGVAVSTLSYICGLSSTDHYARLERGDYDMRLSTLCVLAASLGVEPWELLHPSVGECVNDALDRAVRGET